MMEGDGGTPPVPAGYVPPSLPDQAAGSRAGILRAREVIVSGSSGAPVGVFVYSAGTTPALGNPPIAAITNQTTDPFGNNLKPADSPAAVAEFIVFGTAGSYLQAAAQTGLASLIQGTGDASENKPGLVTTQVSGAGGTRQLETFVSSPQFVTGVPADIALFSTSFDGTVASSINLDSANRINFGLSQAAFWADGTQQLNLPAGGGPFIFGEGFHAVSLPGTGGFSGTIRVKKLPWNAIFLDYALKWTNTAGGTFACGSLPDATYYPAVSTPRRYPMGTGGTPTGDAQAGFFVPSSGALSVFVNASVAGSPDFASGSFMYPTN